MTAFLSVEKTPPVYPVSGVGSGGRISKNARGEYTILAALALNDTIQMFDLPKNARVMGGYLKSDDLDTNGSPAITLDVGIAGNAQLFWAASTVAQAGGTDTTMATTGRDYYVTAKTPVFVTVHAAPATGTTTGTIILNLTYTVEEPK